MHPTEARARLPCPPLPRFNGGVPVTRPQKITLADMRAAGVRGLLVYCSD
jgi:hypothetical protein